jgi:MYXO-CTERM domain-containing protein
MDAPSIDAGGSTQAVFTASLSEELGLTASDMAFSITVDDVLITGVPQVSPSCGAGASLTSEPLGLTGATLTAGQPCTVTLPLSVATDAPRGPVEVSSDGLIATVEGVDTSTGSVSAHTTVLAGAFNVTLESPPVQASDTVVFKMSVDNASDEPSTGNSYSLNLAQALPGAALVGVEIDGGCGDSAQVFSTSSSATLSNLDIAPDVPCVFDVTVEIPDVPPGEFAFTPGPFNLQHSDGVQPLFAAPVRFDVVVPLTLFASFTPDVLEPNATTTLRYELATNGVGAQSDIAFTHDLATGLAGLVATNTPLIDPCGPGSTLTGTDVLTFSSGALDAQDSCSFEVDVQAPAVVPFDQAVALPTGPVTSTHNGEAQSIPAVDLSLSFVPQNCHPGFRYDQGLCVDVDECLESLANCSELATCSNTEGSFECACTTTGYEGDGIVCSDIDECALDACADNAECTNTDGAFDCLCPEGFDGDAFLSCDPICGDGLVLDEACDDGNLDLGDGCGDDCIVEDGFACAGEPSVCAETCGDGVVDRLEECDDGDNNGPDADCLDDCTVPDTDNPTDTDTDGSGCSCASTPVSAPWGLVWLAVLGYAARRRRP